AKVSDDGAKIASRKPKGALAKRLGDSKEMVSHGDVSLAEAWARELARRGCAREPCPGGAESPDHLVHALSSEERSSLFAPCPSHVHGQCWSAEGEAFGSDLQLVATIETDLDRLADQGIEVVA